MISLTLTAHEFTTRLAALRHGERIIYHVGFLYEDRRRSRNCLSVLSTQAAAWEACERGHCHLFQRRISDGVYEYIAQCIDPPKPIRWQGCYREHRILPAVTLAKAA